MNIFGELLSAAQPRTASASRPGYIDGLQIKAAETDEGGSLAVVGGILAAVVVVATGAGIYLSQANVDPNSYRGQRRAQRRTRR